MGFFVSKILLCNLSRRINFSVQGGGGRRSGTTSTDDNAVQGNLGQRESSFEEGAEYAAQQAGAQIAANCLAYTAPHRAAQGFSNLAAYGA